MGVKKKAEKDSLALTRSLMGDKWKAPILLFLSLGTRRFGEIKKRLSPISQKTLTAQLRDLEENGLLKRKIFASVPLRVEYSLTTIGQSFLPLAEAANQWMEKYEKLKRR